MRFGGLTALNNVSASRVRPRRDPRRHRPQRRGQVHLLQLPHRRAAARPRAASISNGEDIAGLPPNASPTRASRAPTRSPISCPGPPCWRTCASPPSRAVTRWSLLRHHSPFTDLLDKRARRAGGGGARRQGRGELAANLSHGEQRNLEIGIALATEPELLCLDEPTAGMSVTETHATVELVRRIAGEPDHHDRGARHGGRDGARPHHHRAPLRRGPGRGHARPRSRPTRACRRCTSRPDADPRRRPHATTASRTSCTACPST